MEYGLTLMVLGAPEFVRISEADYQTIIEAKRGLFECLYVEEKFDLVVENYFELEISLLESAANHMVFGRLDYRYIQVERGLYNRRLANLLSAGRIYADHVKQHIERIFPPDSNNVQELIAKFSEQYDKRLGYRSMEALRNFIQHRGLLVHSMAYKIKRVKRTGEDGLLFMVTPYLVPEELRADGDFKMAVLEELESLGEKIDLKELVRDYIEGLWTVHEKIRERIRPLTEAWDYTMRKAVGRFHSNYPDKDTAGLAAVARDADDHYLDAIPVFTDFIEYRQNLEGKNRNLVNLVNRYVTNEVVDKKL